MLNVYIGFDQSEAVAFHVLTHSILRHASGPVAIIPLVRPAIPYFTRPRGPLDSTDFSISRFMVPHLSDYSGRSIYMDCDMLALGDLYELIFDIAKDPDRALWVVKHDYLPKGHVKMGGEKQTRYYRKNWSSFMVFDNRRCRALTPEYVNTTHGLALHQFDWLREGEIGGLSKRWNFLIGEENQTSEVVRVVHYTRGGPWLPEYADCETAALWWEEARRAGLASHEGSGEGGRVLAHAALPSPAEA